MNWIFTKEGGVLWDVILNNLQKKIMFLSDCELIILCKAKALWGDLACENVNVVNCFLLFSFQQNWIKFLHKMKCLSFAVFHCLY